MSDKTSLEDFLANPPTLPPPAVGGGATVDVGRLREIARHLENEGNCSSVELEEYDCTCSIAADIAVAIEGVVAPYREQGDFLNEPCPVNDNYTVKKTLIAIAGVMDNLLNTHQETRCNHGSHYCSCILPDTLRMIAGVDVPDIHQHRR